MKQVAEACCPAGNYAQSQFRNFWLFLQNGFCREDHQSSPPLAFADRKKEDLLFC